MYQNLATCRVGVVALMLILMVTFLAGCVHRVVSVDDVDKMIKDQLPIGSDKQRVKEFIDNLKVDSLRVLRGDFYKPAFQPVGFWDPKKLDGLWDRVAELINARIVDAETSLLSRSDIFIEFAIDKDGRMIGYTVKMIWED